MGLPDGTAKKKDDDCLLEFPASKREPFIMVLGDASRPLILDKFERVGVFRFTRLITLAAILITAACLVVIAVMFVTTLLPEYTSNGGKEVAGVLKAKQAVKVVKSRVASASSTSHNKGKRPMTESSCGAEDSGSVGRSGEERKLAHI
jgi:hypothetical protein